jgi:N6-L-threonylcarbamoyladenine synthase
MNVLAIETSCDETAAAVVRDGRDILSNVVFSQVALHRPYGGVVPEIASRNHVEKLPPVIAEAREQAGLEWRAIDAVAVTYGPGLATSLLVGLSAAKGLALALERPLMPINHLEGHLYSALLNTPPERLRTLCPLLALIVSGGHSCIVRMSTPGRYQLLGQTIDDAAGEAFDKGANLLKLGYPGGPAIDRAAGNGDPRAVRFPRGILRKTAARNIAIGGRFGFSFSGLKTALLYYLRDHPPGDDPRRIVDIAASYQEAIVDTLVARVGAAFAGDRALTVVGGVSLNRRLRAKLADLARERGVELLLAAPALCMDNAAMIAGLAGSDFPRPDLGDPLALDVDPGLFIAGSGEGTAD